MNLLSATLPNGAQRYAEPRSSSKRHFFPQPARLGRVMGKRGRGERANGVALSSCFSNSRFLVGTSVDLLKGESLRYALDIRGRVGHYVHPARSCSLTQFRKNPDSAEFVFFELCGSWSGTSRSPVPTGSLELSERQRSVLPAFDISYTT